MKPKKTNQKNHSAIDSDALGKIPPQAIDLEEAVLGAILIQNDPLNEVMGLISSDVFYKPAHQIIFEAVAFLYHQNNPVDILTVTEHLRKIGKLDEVGGPYEITLLTNRVASAANVEYHCRLLLEKHLKREIIKVGHIALQQGYSEENDPFESLDSIDVEIQKLGEIVTAGGNIQSAGSIVLEAEKEARKREKLAKEGKCTGIDTGLLQLNKLTGGWQPSKLIILAARPSMGKTAIMLHFSIRAARSGIPVCIYNLETSNTELINRMILACSNIDANRYKSGFMNHEDWNEFEKAKRELTGLPIYVDDNPSSVSMQYIRNHSRQMQKKGKCGIVFVDYLQLAEMRLEERNRTREQEVAQASRQAKIIAKELNVPFILLSQLSRDVEKRGGTRRPMLSDLRESGAIEQDADLVMFIYRAAYYGMKEDAAGNSLAGIGELIMAKNRDGGVGEVPFSHNPSMTKIFDFDPYLEEALKEVPVTENEPF